MNTTGRTPTVGYSDIRRSIPPTQIATDQFQKVFVDWPDLFGGVYQGIIEKAAFPKEATAEAELKSEMADSIPFSGGPWILKSWSHDQAVLIRNDKWYGTPDSSRGGVPSWTRSRSFRGRPAHRDPIAVVRRGQCHLPTAVRHQLLDQVGGTPACRLRGATGATSRPYGSTSAPAAVQTWPRVVELDDDVDDRLRSSRTIRLHVPLDRSAAGAEVEHRASK